MNDSMVALLDASAVVLSMSESDAIAWVAHWYFQLALTPAPMAL